MTFVKTIFCKVSRSMKAHFNINTLSFLIAILAVYISYKSLDESIRQRESMYKPELFVGTVDFCVDISDLDDMKFYYVESDSALREVKMRPWYRLINVGMGSALNVYGHFAFNTETMMNYFSMTGVSGVKLIKGDGFEDTLVFHGDSIMIFNQGFVADWTVDYVLPINQSQEQSIQYFPPNVLDEIVKAYLWVSNEHKTDNTSFFQIPIELDYKDINGKWYRKDLELTISCTKNKNKVYCSIKAGLSLEDSVREFDEAIGN